jgi:hypothetical protein
LGLTFVVVGLVSWGLVSRFYGELPPVPWLPLGTFSLLAVAEAVTARATQVRLDRRPGTSPIDPLLVARLAALSKASSLGGAVFGGVFGGVLLYVAGARDRLVAASDDLPIAAGGVLSCLLLVAAALWLERTCRIPDGPDEPGQDSAPLG